MRHSPLDIHCVIQAGIDGALEEISLLPRTMQGLGGGYRGDCNAQVMALK
jgi:hypothetical protein